jgi:hypothetical protein
LVGAWQRKCRAALTRDAGKDLNPMKPDIFERETARNSGPTRKCAKCGERFALKRRRGRNLSGRKRPRPTRYHEGARYCSDACRFAAHEARRQRGSRRPTTVGRDGAENAKKSAPGANVLSTVGHARNNTATSMPCEGKNQGRASPKNPVLDPRIVPDAKWPGMYRIKLPSGQLSDMVNLTRAKDALANAAGGAA